MEQNRKLIRGLYEDYVQGTVTGEEYLSMKEDYEKRIAALSADIAALNNDNAVLDEQLARYRSMEEDAHRLESDHTLTAELIERLIDRIEITHDHDIHVTFRFQSEFTEQKGRCRYAQIPDSTIHSPVSGGFQNGKHEHTQSKAYLTGEGNVAS